MLNRLKNLKVVKSLGKHISPKLRWLNFMNHNIDKSSPEYIRMISGVDELKFPNIENMKSYELLVDAVIYNYKKKQLQAMDELEK